MTKIPNTDLDVFPLNLGGNVFGWTADEAASFEVLDAYAAGGGNFIDTADVYSAWAPGNKGGESETIIGDWMKSKGNRDQMIIATKVGSNGGLSAKNIRDKVHESLALLKTDYIDLYYSHRDDEKTPIEETISAYDELVKEGKIRYIASSNFSEARMVESLEFSKANNMVSYVAMQPEYNLMERDKFEGPLAHLAERENLAVFPYYSLASGFLTGKYKAGQENDMSSVRSEQAAAYLQRANGPSVLAALEEVANEHRTSMATVALAWLRAQPNVVAPIASARSVEQLGALMDSAHLELTDEQVKHLTLASE